MVGERASATAEAAGGVTVLAMLTVGRRAWAVAVASAATTVAPILTVGMRASAVAWAATARMVTLGSAGSSVKLSGSWVLTLMEREPWPPLRRSSSERRRSSLAAQVGLKEMVAVLMPTVLKVGP